MIDDFLTISIKKPIIADVLLQFSLLYFNFDLLLSTSLFEKKTLQFWHVNCIKNPESIWNRLNQGHNLSTSPPDHIKIFKFSGAVIDLLILSRKFKRQANKYIIVKGPDSTTSIDQF